MQLSYIHPYTSVDLALSVCKEQNRRSSSFYFKYEELWDFFSLHTLVESVRLDAYHA